MSRFEHELKVYKANLPELIGHAGENEGKYVAVKGDKVIGAYGSYDDALTAAYRSFGVGGFLVKKLERVESVLHFTRDIR